MDKWTEMSYARYNRKNEYCDVMCGEEMEQDGFIFELYSYGLFENLTRYYCMSVEDVYGMR